MYQDIYEEPKPNSPPVPATSLSVDDVVLKHYLDYSPLVYYQNVSNWVVYKDPIFLYFFKFDGMNYSLNAKIPYDFSKSLSINNIHRKI